MAVIASEIEKPLNPVIRQGGYNSGGNQMSFISMQRPNVRVASLKSSEEAK
jgi:hypothetical protein